MSAGAGVIALIGRIIFAAFFLHAAIGHTFKHKMVMGHARAGGFPLPFVAGAPTGLWLFAASASIALGVWADVGSLMAGIFVLLALWFHQFWRITEPNERRAQLLNFYRNAGFFGAGLLLFALFGTLGDGLRYALTGSLFHL